MRGEPGKFLIGALKTNFAEDWERYHHVQKNKKLIRESKWAYFKEFCGGIEFLSDTAKLNRIMKRHKTAKRESFRKSDGSFTERQSMTLNLLMESPLLKEAVVRAAISCIARSVVNEAAICFAIHFFGVYKPPGPDSIYPAMLKEGMEAVVAAVKKIFTACLVLAYI